MANVSCGVENIGGNHYIVSTGRNTLGRKGFFHIKNSCFQIGHLRSVPGLGVHQEGLRKIRVTIFPNVFPKGT